MPILDVESFYRGMRTGIIQCAWWKDGVQYVGNTGDTLSAALKEVDDMRAKALEALKEE